MTFEALALSMTNAIRGASIDQYPDRDAVANGTAHGSIGKVLVRHDMRRESLALHSIVFVLAVVFLLLTMTYPGHTPAPM